jgi:hypothetical protein
MEPYPLHYSHHPKPDESMDSNIRLMLDEFQCMDAHFLELWCIEGHLAEKINGYSGALE